MRFVKYSLEGNYGSDPDHYVAFGHEKDRLKVHKIAPSGLLPVEMHRDGPDSPIPLYYPMVMKWVTPIRLSRQKEMSKKAIIKKYGPILTPEYMERLREEQARELEGEDEMSEKNEDLETELNALWESIEELDGLVRKLEGETSAIVPILGLTSAAVFRDCKPEFRKCLDAFRDLLAKAKRAQSPEVSANHFISGFDEVISTIEKGLQRPSASQGQ